MTTKASLTLHARIRPSWCPEWCPWPLPMPGDVVTVSGTDYVVKPDCNRTLVLFHPDRFKIIPLYARDDEPANPSDQTVYKGQTKPYMDHGIPTVTVSRGFGNSSFSRYVGPDADGIARYIKEVEAHSLAVAKAGGYNPEVAHFKALLAML